MTSLTLYNTLTRSKEPFAPIDDKNVRMYVCGPTVYDHAHIGNARPVIVFDVLFRLLRHIYGEDAVKYVRNITDVDDKIIDRARRDFPDLDLNEAIAKVTTDTTAQFQADMKALGCLEPTVEPKATEHIDGMVEMISTLIARGNAYVATGAKGREVLFDVTKDDDYGALSNRKLDDQQAGARVAVESHKRNPGDFVLWKESAADEPGWDGVFEGETIHGRPGWHIECSAMSKAHLGDVFDIHGGGLDLIFPHHENEIAQSCCANGTDRMANIWMHNGYLQVEGKKMSKSDGNFKTVREIVIRAPGDAVRWLMLKTHYTQPVDFREFALLEGASELRSLCEQAALGRSHYTGNSVHLDDIFQRALGNDLNTVAAVSRLHELAKAHTQEARNALRVCLEFLGVRYIDDPNAFSTAVAGYGDIPNAVFSASIVWKQSSNNGLHSVAEEAFEEARKYGWLLSGGPGHVNFHSMDDQTSPDEKVERVIAERLALISEKNWAEADRIRDELLAQGIQLKDGKDPETGERTTTWEVVR